MTAAEKKHTCPHCGSGLLAFELPEAGGWDARHHLACFNDECPYFRRGWEWMMTRYNRKASYRYRIDPASGHESPIAVWSESALRDRIVAAKPKAPPKKSRKRKTK